MWVTRKGREIRWVRGGREGCVVNKRWKEGRNGDFMSERRARREGKGVRGGRKGRCAEGGRNRGGG